MKGIILTLLVAALLGGGGTFLWKYYGGFSGEHGEVVAFINTYGEYVDVAEEVEFLVHLPGTEGNADRGELLALLEAILTKEMTAERRGELARLAFSNLDVLKKEIDAAQVAQAKLYEVLQDLDVAARSFTSMDLHARATEIVDLARKRAEVSSRITSILSEINDHTYAIITQILDDQGELTNSHITAINTSTTEAEERFDTLSALYEQLIDLREEVTEKTALLAAHAT
jgi:hypothetical protein